MNVLQEYWAELNDRQHKLVIIAGVVLAFIVFYALIWEPVHDSVLRLRQEVQRNEKLLVWMQQAQVQLKRARQTNSSGTLGQGQSLVTVVEKSLQKAQLGGGVTALKQVDSQRIELSLTESSYGDLVKWLNQFQDQYGITLERVTLKRTDVPGMVNANIVMTR